VNTNASQNMNSYLIHGLSIDKNDVVTKGFTLPRIWSDDWGKGLNASIFYSTWNSLTLTHPYTPGNVQYN